MGDELDTLISDIKHEDESEAHQVLRNYIGNKHRRQSSTEETVYVALIARLQY